MCYAATFPQKINFTQHLIRSRLQQSKPSFNVLPWFVRSLITWQYSKLGKWRFAGILAKRKCVTRHKNWSNTFLFRHARALALGMAMWVHHFGPDWNISSTTWNCVQTDQSDHYSWGWSLLTLFLVPPVGESFHIFSKYLNTYQMDGQNCWYRHSWFPDNVC